MPLKMCAIFNAINKIELKKECWGKISRKDGGTGKEEIASRLARRH